MIYINLLCLKLTEKWNILNYITFITPLLYKYFNAIKRYTL